VTDRVPIPYRTTGKIIIALYILNKQASLRLLARNEPKIGDRAVVQPRQSLCRKTQYRVKFRANQTLLSFIGSVFEKCYVSELTFVNENVYFGYLTMECELEKIAQ
jgi:hypothetical protein